MTNLSESDYKLIEAKIDGSMSDQELDEFEQKLRDSEDFEREFQIQDAVIHSLIRSNDKVLKKEFHSFLQESKAHHRQNKKQRRNLMIAASLSFLVFCSVAYYWFLPDPMNNSAIYQAYFEVYPAPPITRGDDEIGAVPIDFSDYRKGNYAQAMETLQSGPQSEMTSLYLAMCYLETEQVSKAIENIQATLDSTNPIIKQTAEWYLALAHIKNNDQTKSLPILQKITDEKQLYYKQANKILLEIK